MKLLMYLTVLAVALVSPNVASAEKISVELVADISGAMPTGITVAPNGRIFLNFPKWGDAPEFTVGELKNGKVVPYPSHEINQTDLKRPAKTLINVQSVVTDAANRLWILDTASPKFITPIKGGAKLVAVDLASNKVVKTIVLSEDVVLPTTYLNDVRFDLRHGKEGVAYITDSSSNGIGGIIVVDLATGDAVRHLTGHKTTSPDKSFDPVIEGTPFMHRPASGKTAPFQVASDGIAISPDGATLYYCPLSSRYLYSVATAALRAPGATDDTITPHIQNLGLKGASDGLAADDQGRVYGGDYENNAIRRYANGKWTTIAQGPKILWPDTLSVGTDGYLYFTANQLHRQPGFHKGVDLRKQPYQILRINIGAGPVLLK